jgi:TRAP-type C4-dicarboxylate transport system permease small subunit
MHRVLLQLSRLMAILGGAVLSALILLTCLSILGRLASGLLHGPAAQELAPGLASWLLAAGVGPIRGDFELVEAGMAFAIFAFLPYCHITGGHAAVDVFTARLPPRAARVLAWAIEVAFAAALVLIAVQLYGGMVGKRQSGQTTFLIEFPVWWAYAASLSGAALAAAVAVHMAVARTGEVLSGRAILPPDAGAGH